MELAGESDDRDVDADVIMAFVLFVFTLIRHRLHQRSSVDTFSCNAAIVAPTSTSSSAYPSTWRQKAGRPVPSATRTGMPLPICSAWRSRSSM